MKKCETANQFARLKSNFFVRLLSSLVIFPVAVGLIILGGNYFLIFVAVLSAVMAWEVARITIGKDKFIILVFVTIGNFLIITILSLEVEILFVVSFVLFWACSLIIIGVFCRVLGVVFRFLVYNLFIIIPCFSILWLRETESLNIVLWIILSVIATDVGAYIAGKTLGGKRLAPKISPNKTWAGLLGGMFASGTVGGLLGYMWLGNPLVLIVISIVIAIVSQMGDLLESIFKRRYAIKESSNLIPGHGGVLDRLDGHMAAITFMAFYVLVSDKAIMS